MKLKILKNESKGYREIHTDKRNIILDPSVKTKRTPCLDTTLPSTCEFIALLIEQHF